MERFIGPVLKVNRYRKTHMTFIQSLTHVSRARQVYVALGSPCPSRDAPAEVEHPSEALPSSTSQ